MVDEINFEFEPLISTSGTFAPIHRSLISCPALLFKFHSFTTISVMIPPIFALSLARSKMISVNLNDHSV